MSHYLNRVNLVLAAVVLLAAFLRFYELGQLPPGFEFDVAFKVFDILRLLQGQFAIFFPAYTGREPLYHYLSMAYVSNLGTTAFSLKLHAAVIGTATVPLVYLCARSIFRSTRIGLLTAFFTAISFWDLFFSRVGYRVILLVPLTLLMFWSLWHAICLVSSGSRRDGRFRWWAFTGFFAALSLYTYPSSRVFPIALVLLVAYAAWRDRPRLGEYVRGFGVMLGVTVLLFLPLGAYFAMHPDQFAGHPADVSIFAQHGDAKVDVAGALVQNALRLLGMFFVAGDGSALRNWPGRPVFDPLLAALFLAGVCVWAVALFSPRSSEANRRRAAFLLVWLGSAMGISLFSVDAPEFSRMLYSLPAVMMLPAWGASTVWDWIKTPALQRAAFAGFAVVAVASTATTYRDYFVLFANDPGTYYAFDTDKVEISNWINQHASTEHIYIAPLLQQNGTISLLTRYAPIQSFESRDTIVLPSGKDGEDAVFAFPWEQDKKAQTMEERLGGLASREELDGSNGGKLLILDRVPAQALPGADPLAALNKAGPFVQAQTKTSAVWGGEFELIGYSVGAADSSKRNLEVTLFFHALNHVSNDYTFSVKVRDARDRTWGQEDKWAGDNSFQTTHWNPGDVVVEKFYPGLSACAPAGDYHLTVEAYDPKTQQVLSRSDLNSALADLGSWHADASPSNRLEDLEPDQTVAQHVGPGLDLIGYTLTPNSARAGDPFSLSLFWKGSADGSAQPIHLSLRTAGKQYTLADASAQIPPEGRGLCTLYDLSVPPGLAAGPATIWVGDSKVADMDVAK